MNNEQPQWAQWLREDRAQLAMLCRRADTRCVVISRTALSWNPHAVINPHTRRPFSAQEAWSLVASGLARRRWTRFVEPLPKGLDLEVSFLMQTRRERPLRVQVGLGQGVVVGQIFDHDPQFSQQNINFSGEA